MPASFLHGVEVIESTIGPLPITIVKSAVIGLVGSAPMWAAAGAIPRWDYSTLTVAGFQILDSEDQLRLIKKVLRALELDETRWVPKDLQYFINAQKDEGHRPTTLADAGDPTRRMMLKVYAAYEDACRRAGAVDFAELLLRSFELWRDQPALLAHYQRRFRHVLVDEFQDTNAIQYLWLRLLAGPASVPFVVGVTKDLTSRVHAGKVVGEAGRKAGGGGNGPPNFAKGGGTQPAQLGAALQHAFAIVEQALQED